MSQELITGWLAGTLSSPDEEAFAELLRADAELQRALIREAHLQRALRQAVRDRVTCGELGFQATEPTTNRTARLRRSRPLRMSRSRWLAPLVTAAAALLAVVVGVYWFAPASSGPLLEVNAGTVTVDGRPVDARTKLTPGAHIAVVSGTAVMRTSDGSAVVLSAGTTAVVGDGLERVLDLQSGTASASVTPQPADRRFIITAPRLDTRVVGTAYTLRVLEDRTRLTVTEGVVAAIPRQGAERKVRAGEQFSRSDDVIGWRFHSSGDDVVRLHVDHDLRHEGRATLALDYTPPAGALGWDLVQRPFRVAGRDTVRVWLYIDAADERAAMNVQVVEEDGETWMLSFTPLSSQPLRSWIPLDVSLKKPLKRMWKVGDEKYDPDQVRAIRVVPNVSASRFHVDIVPD